MSKSVDAAIRQALASEPEQRFASVLDFARTLREAAEGATPESVSRRRDDSQARAKKRRGGEPVSPFFNPVQGATEAFRRVATGTARVRALASRLRSWPAPVSRRVALAGLVLLLAFAGAAVLARRAPSGKAAPSATVAAAAPAAPPSAPPPEIVPAAAEPPAATAPPAAATAEAAAPAASQAAADQPEEVAPPKNARAAAWARLATGARSPNAAVRPAPVVKTTVAARPVARSIAKAVPKASPAPKKVAAAAPAAGGSCVMSVGSKPPADVWIDEKSLGRRTPVAAYHLACGEHKLVLKRADLDIYQMEMITLRPGAHFKKVYPLQ